MTASPFPRRVGAAVVLVAVVLLVVLVWLFWTELVMAGIGFFGLRFAARRAGLLEPRRRRPKSSWSSLGRTAALMYAAWNSRWLRPTEAAPRARAGSRAVGTAGPIAAGPAKSTPADGWFGEVPF